MKAPEELWVMNFEDPEEVEGTDDVCAEAFYNPCDPSDEAVMYIRADIAAEKEKERKQARSTSQFWKDNHLAGNAEIERLKIQLTEKEKECERLQRERDMLSGIVGGYIDDAQKFIESAKKFRAALTTEGEKGEETQADEYLFVWACPKCRYTINIHWATPDEYVQSECPVCNTELESAGRVKITTKPEGEV